MNFLEVLILKLEYKGSDQGMLSVSLCRASASFELEISAHILASNKLRNFHVINFVLLSRRSMSHVVFIGETLSVNTSTKQILQYCYIIAFYRL